MLRHLGLLAGLIACTEARCSAVVDMWSGSTCDGDPASSVQALLNIPIGVDECYDSGAGYYVQVYYCNPATGILMGYFDDAACTVA